MTETPVDLQLEADLRAELAVAAVRVAEVQQLVDDLRAELARRANFEMMLLRASPEALAVLREMVDYAAARPAHRRRKTAAAREAA